jgi:hypothetical protein
MLAALHIVLLAGPSYAVDELYGPHVKVRSNTILVSTGINLDKESIELIQKGVPQEATFYIDLFRQWDRWPDEFVVGMKIVQGFSCDPVKKEYVATSKRGKTINRRRFNTCEQLINWSMSLPDEKIVTTAEMEKGAYYIKVGVKRKSKRLPLFFDLLFFFLPGEKSMERNSSLILLHEDK